MATIGILFCGYRTIEYVAASLRPWQEAQTDKLGNNEWVISAVSLPFDKYKDMNDANTDDGTQAYLRDEYNNHRIDYLATEPEFLDEAAARNLALKPLLAAGCDLIWCWDSDEIIKEEQIEKILKFIENNLFENWFSLSYKNYVFDKNTYITEPFTPPRIFRVNAGGLSLNKFYWDNDILYYYGIKGIKISYKELSNKTIPSNLVLIDHFTWLNDEKSKNKCEYQKKHFGHCGYRWNDIENKLEFDTNFYLKNGLMIPSISRDK